MASSDRPLTAHLFVRIPNSDGPAACATIRLTVGAGVLASIRLPGTEKPVPLVSDDPAVVAFVRSGFDAILAKPTPTP